MNHLLGIDYGTKHLGLAIATGPLAEPVATVPTGQSFDRIKQLIAEHQIDQIVIGISENQMADETKAFAESVKQSTKLPTVLHDETLSSLETRQKIAAANIKKSKREAKIDHLVAASILQDYIDSLKK